jgi:hypothetical protein
MSFTPFTVEACSCDSQTAIVSRRTLSVYPLNSLWTKLLVAQWSPIIQRDGRSLGWPDVEWNYAGLEAEAHFLDANPRGAVWVTTEEELPLVLGVIVVSGPACAEELQRALGRQQSVLWLENVAISPRLRRDCPRERRLPFELLRLGQLMTKWAIQESFRGGSGWLGLHADGAVAAQKYGPRSSQYPSAWDMRSIGSLAHRSGESYSAFVGDDAWSTAFVQSLDEALAKEIGS